MSLLSTIAAIPGNKTSIFPEDFSSTDNVLSAGRKWNAEGGAKAFAAHTIVPVSTIATAALDALVHALGAVLKTAVFVPKAIVYIASIGTVDIAPGASLTAIFKHAARSVGYVTMVVVAPLTSLFSCDAALSILQGLSLAPAPAPIVSKGVWKQALDQEGVAGKLKFLWANAGAAAKEAVIDTPKNAVSSTWNAVSGSKGAGGAVGVAAAVALLGELGGRFLLEGQKVADGETSYAQGWKNVFGAGINTGSDLFHGVVDYSQSALCAATGFGCAPELPKAFAQCGEESLACETGAESFTCPDESVVPCEVPVAGGA